nr:hypothetical protein [Tanacetum cinerariifolium]
SGGAGGSGGTGGNADGTGVRGTEPTVPKLTGYTYETFIKCDPFPFIGTEGASVIQRTEKELYNLRMKGMDIDGQPKVRKEKVKVIGEVVVIIDVSITVVKTREEVMQGL